MLGDYFARLIYAGNCRRCANSLPNSIRLVPCRIPSKIVSRFPRRDVPANFRCARLLPNARTIFTFDLLKRDLLVAETSVVISPSPPSPRPAPRSRIDLFLFFYQYPPPRAIPHEGLRLIGAALSGIQTPAAGNREELHAEPGSTHGIPARRK